MENLKHQHHKCHLFMTSKSTAVNQRSLASKFISENPDSYTNSRKSKYTSNTKLTKSSLFKCLSGLNLRKEQQILNQLNLQIQLLQGSHFNLNHLTNHVKNMLSDSFYGLSRTVDEFSRLQN